MDKGVDGSFLVRASTHSPGNYVLSARVDGEVAHVIIKVQAGQFDVGGGPPFKSLNELIGHYKTHSMIETSGRVITLKNPFNATSFMAKSIKDRVSELEKESGDILGKAGFWEEFEVSYFLITCTCICSCTCTCTCMTLILRKKELFVLFCVFMYFDSLLIKVHVLVLVVHSVSVPLNNVTVGKDKPSVDVCNGPLPHSV